MPPRPFRFPSALRLPPQ